MRTSSKANIGRVGFTIAWHTTYKHVAYLNSNRGCIRLLNPLSPCKSDEQRGNITESGRGTEFHLKC